MSVSGITLEETYLGDGLYASYDGFTFWLRAPREDGDHVVALEPLVLAEFMRYVTDVEIVRKHGR